MKRGRAHKSQLGPNLATHYPSSQEAESRTTLITMASGWTYLLPDSDSDGEGDYDPVTLPDGRLACYRHLSITCYKCCVDYSFMEPDSDFEGEDDDSIGSMMDGDDDVDPSTATLPSPGPQLTRGTGRVFPTRFPLPSPTSTPDITFPGQTVHVGVTRFVHREDPQKALIFTDGACLNNGQPNPKAGWAFVTGPSVPGDHGNGAARVVAGRLENKGPFGDEGGQTSNRAEMRAVIAALRFRNWPGEGFQTLVIATDSEYVVDGATDWVRGWVRNGWTTRAGGAVKNKDLWQCLLGEVEKFHDHGMEVEFWRIPRELNTIADAAAKTAAGEDRIDSFREIFGLT